MELAPVPLSQNSVGLSAGVGESWSCDTGWTSGSVKLPNPSRAVVDIEKLRGYCLSRTHVRGRHKARVFESALGLRAENAETLRRALLQAAVTYDVTRAAVDQHGERYMLDFPLIGPAGKRTVRSFWIVLTGEDIARLTTCYVL